MLVSANLADPFTPGTVRSSRRWVVFTPQDEEIFSVILRQAWPNMRFTVRDRPDAGRTRDDIWCDGTNTWLDPFPRFASLSDRSSNRLWCWNEPPGWVPDWRHYKVWSGPNELAVRFRIANLPVMSIEYDRGFPGRRSAWRLPAAEFCSVWDSRVPEASRFVAKVWRLLAKFADNRVDVVSDDTGAASHSRIKGDWIGPDAASWCRENPARRLGFTQRPAGSPGGPMPREEWLPAFCDHAV